MAKLHLLESQARLSQQLICGDRGGVDLRPIPASGAHMIRGKDDAQKEQENINHQRDNELEVEGGRLWWTGG